MEYEATEQAGSQLWKEKQKNVVACQASKLEKKISYLCIHHLQENGKITKKKSE